MRDEQPSQRRHDGPIAAEAQSRAIDALRGAAVVAVLEYHYGSLFKLYAWLGAPAAIRTPLAYGYAGVDLFFVLSAYLLTMSLVRIRANQAAGARKTAAFYVRRLFRIGPLYLVLLASAAVYEALASGRAETPVALDRIAPLWRYMTFTQPYYLAQFPEWTGHYLAPTYSLAVEEHFYLVLPLLVVLLSRDALKKLAILSLALAPLIRLRLSIEIGDLAAIAWPIARIDSFGWGVLVALAAPQDKPALEKLRVGALAAALLAFGYVLAAQRFGLPYGHDVGEAALSSALAALSCGVLMWVLDSAPGAGSLKPLVSALAWAGRRCFPIYLFQMPVIFVIADLRGTGSPNVESAADAGFMLLATIALLVLSDVTHRLIERPATEAGGALARRILDGRRRVAMASLRP
ncbi:MAG: acyltransferase [Hyphomicrobiales bacterium]|nr:acyltransferase [Hyphomicrobiales bacterium]